MIRTKQHSDKLLTHLRLILISATSLMVLDYHYYYELRDREKKNEEKSKGGMLKK